MQKPAYSGKAVAALRSPDDLEKAIRVTNPRVWMVLLACVALLLGLLAWGFFGSISAGVQAVGMVKDGRILCLLDVGEARAVRAGDTALADGTGATVESVEDIPVSRSEALAVFNSEYLVDVNRKGDWGVWVTLIPEEGHTLPEGKPLSLSIATERIAPISLILGGLET